MRTRRRFLRGGVLAPVASGVTAALAACAPLGPGGAGGQGGEAVPGPSKAPVTVRYAHGWSALYVDRLDKIVADFSARHPTVKAANESPAYNDLPHWGAIKSALASDVLVAQTPMDVELDTLTAAAVTEVYQGKTAPKDALAFAQREGQRRLDEFWAGVKR